MYVRFLDKKEVKTYVDRIVFVYPMLDRMKGSMNTSRFKSLHYIAEAAVIAAMYAALTIFLAPISSGEIQVRVAEALTVMPYFISAAVPGLFVGCFIANIFVGQGVYDMVLGPLVTLLAAVITRKMPNKYLAPLPPVVLNAVYVGILLNFVANLPIIITLLFVAAGEFIACYGLGVPLMHLLEKHYYKNGFDGENIERQ